jgi:photosystem II stability/assembly factor-like uncharacterized protein
LLDVWCGPDGKAIAVGAYGSYYASEDGGGTWQARRLNAAKAPGTSDEADLADPHLNRIAATGQGRFYIAGEAGHLYRSDDAGARWIELDSPYDGSFFGILPLDAQSLLAFGLRGHLYRSQNAGASWTKIETGTVAMLNDAARIGARGVVIVGLSGNLLVSGDGGSSFTMHQQPDRKGLSAVIADDTGAVVAVGEGGAKVIEVAAGAAR